MANVWAIKNGDWSDPTLWNTGALPTSSDDVYANNFNININQNTTVNSLRNTANTGITAGGTFNFNTSGVTANINDNIYSSTVGLILITANSGIIKISIVNAIIRPNITAQVLIDYTGNCNFELSANLITNSNNISNTRVINKTSSGILTINSNISGGNNIAGSGNGSATIYLASSSISYINGNVTGGTGSNDVSRAINIVAGDLTINGNVIGGSGILGNLATITITSSGNIKVIGDVTGNVSKAIYATNGNIDIIGNITGSNSNGIPAIEILGTANLNHVGAAKASSFASAIVCSNPYSCIVTSTGPFLKNGYIVAVASQTLRINFNSNSYFQFMKSNGEDIDYVSTVEGYNYPTPADVRHGVSYKSGLAVGTCHVPSPDNVRKNIPVDNTVGTSDNVNAEDILEAIQNSNLPIAARLRNVATVESTGAQLEAYQ